MALFVGNLFDWYHTWGFTSTDSIPVSIVPFLLYLILFSFGYFVLIAESILFLFIIFYNEIILTLYIYVCMYVCMYKKKGKYVRL